MKEYGMSVAANKMPQWESAGFLPILCKKYQYTRMDLLDVTQIHLFQHFISNCSQPQA